MAESKILEQDKDEWIYHSMNKYSNLYMFELEYPLDALEIINETSLCVAGIQEYSKKCELLQLCVPPKLLRSDDEEGLCKDRDFKILSGGYAEGRVRQIKFIRESSNLIATCQDGYDGVFIYEVGDDNRATILERQSLTFGSDDAPSGSVPSSTSLSCMKNRIFLGSKSSKGDTASSATLHEWATDSSFHIPVKTHSIWKGNPSNLKLGHLQKLKEWDDHTIAFLTNHGTVALYDLRSSSETPEIYFHATKSPNNNPQSSSSSAPIIFSFDAIPGKNKIGLIDSCGGYEVFDPRKVNSGSDHDHQHNRTSRSLLPDFGFGNGAYPEYFNIEYEQREKDSCRFIISGVKKECVPVYEEELVIAEEDKTFNVVVDNNQCSEKQLELQLHSVFSHDGHSKPVTHSMWHPHPVSDNLIFSASLDAVLHAWQFIPEINK